MKLLFVSVLVLSFLQFINLSLIVVNKCCPINQIMVDNKCDYSPLAINWVPHFSQPLINQQYKFEFGFPKCQTTELWAIYHQMNDKLYLLNTGVLRHEYSHENYDDEIISHDYINGQYCLDKSLVAHNRSEQLFAFICVPKKDDSWTSTEFLIKRVFDPIFRTIAIFLYLFVAIVYFIMNNLRDLVGSIVITISVCLIVVQVADIVRIFTEFAHHFSFLTAEIVTYTSLLAVFLWINSLGFHIWRTFKSRNVFLRVTDARKYCYYSFYVWPTVFFLSAFGIFAHFTLSLPEKSSFKKKIETIDSLGMSIFFVPIALTILANAYFYSKTLVILNRMNTYGRIHNKLRHSLRLFVLLTLIMIIDWVFMLMSTNATFLSLTYCYIFVNGVHALLYFYVCIINQKHVIYLLKKACCYQNCCWQCCRPEQEHELEWGEELTAMNPSYI